MREIKFRAWYGEQIGMREPEFNGRINEIFSYEHGVYMQYTGLKDKNGVEIYEGDIVRVESSFNGYVAVGVVVFENASFGLKVYKCEFGNGDFIIPIGEERTRRLNSYEVSGNIHEHKHLLEGVK